MDKQKIYGILRHVLGAVGGFLVALGYTSAEAVADVLTNVETVVGAITVVVATITSIVAKIRGNIDNPTPAQAAAKAPDAVDKAADKKIDAK